MPPNLHSFANDYIVLVKNDEAITELAKLGIRLPTTLSKLLHVIDNKRTFKQCVASAVLISMQEFELNEALRSLIRLGFVDAVPATARSLSDQEASITATQRLKVIATANDPAVGMPDMTKTGSQTVANRAFSSGLNAQDLNAIKADLLLELRRLLGKDVSLVQDLIETARDNEQLIRAVTGCSRVLEAAVSIEASKEFVAAFSRLIHKSIAPS